MAPRSSAHEKARKLANENARTALAAMARLARGKEPERVGPHESVLKHARGHGRISWEPYARAEHGMHFYMFVFPTKGTAEGFMRELTRFGFKSVAWGDNVERRHWHVAVRGSALAPAAWEKIQKERAHDALMIRNMHEYNVATGRSPKK
ncbi:MAG: hypothetical protein ACHREM_25405 [Polyangiales bacterium]